MATFEEQFHAFSKFGDTKSDGKLLSLSQSDKWMKQAKIFDAKKITTTDTGIHFKKLKQPKLGIEDYKKFLDDLCKTRKVEMSEVMGKLTGCGLPGLSGTAIARNSGTVARLTDTSKYTGTHKQRFDDSGKGKGISGRENVTDNSGYVAGYQNKDTYGK